MTKANQKVCGRDRFPLSTTYTTKFFAEKQIDQMKQTIDYFGNGITANFFGGL